MLKLTIFGDVNDDEREIFEASKLPLDVLETIAEPVFEFVAVVALFETFPADIIVASFESVILAPLLIMAMDLNDLHRRLDPA